MTTNPTTDRDHSRREALIAQAKHYDALAKAATDAGEAIELADKADEAWTEAASLRA